MDTIVNDLGKALDQKNEQIDRMIGIESTSDYVESLNQPQTGSYLVRPDGSVEFFKS